MITIIRAIGVEFVHRAVRPFVIGGALVVATLLGLGGWLTTQSPWWWLLETAFIIGSLVFVLIVVVIYAILRTVAPPLSKTQKKAVAIFVDKLKLVAERIQTPQIVIIYTVVRDTMSPKQNGFIETVTKDSKTLASEFAKLRKKFDHTI